MLVLPVFIFKCGEQFFYDKQACNGLRLWLENFDEVILCNPLVEARTPPSI